MRQLRVAAFSLVNAPFRLIRKRTPLFGASALFLCCAAGVSYAGSAGLKPLNLAVDTHYYQTLGKPAEALVTKDGYVLVSISAGGPGDPYCPSPPAPAAGQTGVQVFKPTFGGLTNACGSQNIINLPQPPNGQPIASVFGMKFFPGRPQVSVGAAVEADGGEFFRLTNLNACTIDGVINVQQPPVVTTGCTNCAPGTFDLAVTPNGPPEYAFVANEYGLVPYVNIEGAGTIGVIRVQRDFFGRFTRATLADSREPRGRSSPMTTFTSRAEARSRA